MTASVQVTASEAPEVRPEATTNPQAPAQSQTAERPAWLPEKFASGEDLAKSYAELEKRVGGGQPESATSPAAEAQVTQALQANGLDMSSFNAEYNANGKLSDESYQKLEKAGLNKAFVDDYIRGQEAVAAQEIAEVMSAVGGAAEFAKIQSWAKVNLPAAELEAFNKVIDSAPKEVIKTVVEGLQAKYIRANGREPKLVNGQNGSSAGGFRSNDEMIRAMSDPRYRKDPAYRADVEAKVALSRL
jgi:hypothetical protein